MFWETKFSRRMSSRRFVPGHEFFGTVVALGKGAKEKHGIDVGDMVTADRLCLVGNAGFCRTEATGCVRVHDIHGLPKGSRRWRRDGGIRPAFRAGISSTRCLNQSPGIPQR